MTKFTNIYQKQRHLHNPSYRSEWMAQILGRNHHQNHLIAVTRPYRCRSTAQTLVINPKVVDPHRALQRQIEFDQQFGRIEWINEFST
jgi:hypothetical protein